MSKMKLLSGFIILLFTTILANGQVAHNTKLLYGNWSLPANVKVSKQGTIPRKILITKDFVTMYFLNGNARKVKLSSLAKDKNISHLYHLRTGNLHLCVSISKFLYINTCCDDCTEYKYIKA